ncbi:hypothetical protein BJD55_gp029 [Gordonia phage Yvonnetastic]|uniref:Uncharacterized protein n=1 Tax=Gordonia phage Yvonnetastic TaxID=1821566 RepID=A0A142K9F4_9CAUD|nr:hypothetical protein BJD55_gp029 [Gordonia phage Yvonnetastic]AMS02737.1 hypothetical protein SEA_YVONNETASTIC_193 [Gordonia phage Yvonnetastic]
MAIKIGDTYTYSRLTSKADYWARQFPGPVGHRDLGFLKGRECSPNNDRSCTLCYDQWERHTSTVVDIQHYMDNSVEVILKDGTRHTAVAPHGDACY